MLNGNRISLLFGLPGAGKTTTLEKVLPLLPNLLCLSGGSLLAGELSAADRDSLRKLGADKILTNQEKVVLNFNNALRQISWKHVVFDGHCMVKDGTRIVAIPLSVVARLCPDNIMSLRRRLSSGGLRIARDRIAKLRRLRNSQRFDSANLKYPVNTPLTSTYRSSLPVTKNN